MVSVLDSRRRRAQVQIAAATLSGNSLRQTVHTHCASVHQAAKLVAVLLRVARVTAGLAVSNGSLPSGLWLTSPAGWLPRTGISSRSETLCSVFEYGLPLPFSHLYLKTYVTVQTIKVKVKVKCTIPMRSVGGVLISLSCIVKPSVDKRLSL